MNENKPSLHIYVVNFWNGGMTDETSKELWFYAYAESCFQAEPMFENLSIPGWSRGQHFHVSENADCMKEARPISEIGKVNQS